MGTMRDRAKAGAWLIGWLLVACAAPDADRDGFVLVDEGARRAGIAVDVSGERHDAVLPVAVPGGAEANVVRATGLAEPLVVAPGELVEIVGPDGEVRRSAVPRDALDVRGDEGAVRSLAEMMDAQVVSLGDGRLRLSGPDVFVIAAMLGPLPGIVGVRAPAPAGASEPDLLDVGFVLAPGAPALPTLEPGADGAAAAPDAASLVGYYEHGPAAALLDAAGGYVLYQGGREVGRGRFAPRPGGITFVPADGGGITWMALDGERLVDGVGLALTPVEAR